MIIMKSQKQKLKRGDIVLVLFPNSDLVTAKTRPALIVQTNHINTGLEQYIVVMITSNLSRSGHPSRVRIELTSNAGTSSGLLSDSVVMTDNIATVKSSEIYDNIGWIEMDEVDKALRYTLNL